jgi:hypothetical protein
VHVAGSVFVNGVGLDLAAPPRPQLRDRLRAVGLDLRLALHPRPQGALSASGSRRRRRSAAPRRRPLRRRDLFR